MPDAQTTDEAEDDMTARSTLVVGATSGIGLATALELARRGDRLTLVARPGSALGVAADRCVAAGSPAVEVVEGDVAVVDDVRRMVEVHLGAHDGRLDAVVLSAAVMAYGRLEELPAELFQAVVDTAVHGTMHLARAALPVMRAQRSGVFVVVNSLLGSVTVPQMGAYAASKWGQRAVVRTLQQETRDLPGLHVCLVSPGSINTPIYYQAANVTGRAARPPFPVLQPERAGRKVANLLDRPRRHLSFPVGPPNPVIVAGYRLLPRVYDAIVGPAFRVAALRDDLDPTDGTVHRPRPDEERLRGRWPTPK